MVCPLVSSFLIYFLPQVFSSQIPKADILAIYYPFFGLQKKQPTERGKVSESQPSVKEVGVTNYILHPRERPLKTSDTRVGGVGGSKRTRKSDNIEQVKVGRQVKKGQKIWDVINGRSLRRDCLPTSALAFLKQGHFFLAKRSVGSKDHHSWNL